ncbi:MAG: methionine--tRNA ligase subunit beta [Planctomycetes bacterium]|nr:methionine--tRNA ligase subunit beta [Planctomycetota bacterium]
MPPKPDVVLFEDFHKLDLRIAKIVEAIEHPNADRLFLLKIDLGSEQRQLCAGLRGHYTAEQLVGKNIVVVANLAPRKVRGELSQGMLLAAGNEDHSQVILLTTEADIAPGSSVS